MTELDLLRSIQLDEARALLRFAARKLSPIERHALMCFGFEGVQADAAREWGVTRAGVFEAQKRAREKVRKQFARMGITHSSQLVG